MRERSDENSREDEAGAAFCRWRDEGDVRALGVAFEACSRELLARAERLSPHDAEDLAQAVFLLAMRRAHRFRSGCALLPWLTGMLRLSLRDRMRSWRRRRAREESAAREVLTGSPDLSWRETEELVSEAVANLPLAERDVVRLRHLEGLDVATVAQRLSIPEGTVKTRARRGLGRLRQALPAGLATGLLLMLRFREGAPGPAPLLPSKLTSLRPPAAKPLAVAGLVTLASIGLLVATAGNPLRDPNPSLATPIETESPAAAGLAESGSSAPLGVTPSKRRPAAPAPPSAAPAWALRGVVLRDGRPVSGAEVALEAWPPRASLPRTVLTTGADGRFDLSLDPIASWPRLARHLTSLHLAAWHPVNGHSESELIEGLPLDGNAGFTRELRLEIPSTPRLTGRVTGPDGSPCPEAFVRIDPAAGSPENPHAFTTTTDALGRYTLDHPGHAEVVLRAAHNGTGAGTRRLSLPSFPGPQALADLVLEPRSALSGFVRKPNGLPAKGRVVRLSPSAAAKDAPAPASPRPLAPLRAITDDRGAFRIAGLEAGRYALALGDASTEPARQARPPLRIEGERTIDLIDERPELQLTCLEPQGWPLRGITLRLTDLARPTQRLLIERTTEAGTFHVPLPSHGTYRMLISAPGAEPHEATIEIPQGATVRRTVALRPLSAAAVVAIDLRDPSGVPVSLASVHGFPEDADPYREAPHFEFTTLTNRDLLIPAGRHRLLIEAVGQRPRLEAMTQIGAQIDLDLAPGERRILRATLRRRARLDLNWAPSHRATDPPATLEVHLRATSTESAPWHPITDALFRLGPNGPEAGAPWPSRTPIHWFPAPRWLARPLEIRLRLNGHETITDLRLAAATTTTLRLP